MRIHGGKKRGLAAMAALACLAATYLAWPVPLLQVRTGPPDSRLSLALPLSPGQRIAVGFVHSLYRVVQEERYVLRDGDLQLASVFFGSFDALNYYDPLGLLPHRARQGGYEVVMDPPRRLPVHFALAHSTPIWLRLHQADSVRLDQLLKANQGFALQVAHLPRAAAWFVEKTHGYN
jgi:hypothetical protein